MTKKFDCEQQLLMSEETRGEEEDERVKDFIQMLIEEIYKAARHL